MRLIFNKYVNEGYGAQRLSRYLSENKIYRADGSNFPNTSINRMIKNPIYTGVIHNGDAISEEVPELRIIDRDTYDRAQTIMQSRTQQHSDIPLNLKGSALLVGKVYCGHCGNRLTLTTSGKRKTCIDGSVQWVSWPRYQCHYKVRHPDSCDGQSGYGVPKLDAIVDQVIRSQLEKIKGKPGEDMVTAQHEKMLELTKTRMNLCSSRLAAKRRELEDYRSEILRVIRGESRFTADMLNELIEQGREEEKQKIQAGKDHAPASHPSGFGWAVNRARRDSPIQNMLSQFQTKEKRQVDRRKPAPLKAGWRFCACSIGGHDAAVIGIYSTDPPSVAQNDFGELAVLQGEHTQSFRPLGAVAVGDAQHLAPVNIVSRHDLGQLGQPLAHRKGLSPLADLPLGGGAHEQLDAQRAGEQGLYLGQAPVLFSDCPGSPG